MFKPAGELGTLSRGTETRGTDERYTDERGTKTPLTPSLISTYGTKKPPFHRTIQQSVSEFKGKIGCEFKDKSTVGCEDKTYSKTRICQWPNPKTGIPCLCSRGQHFWSFELNMLIQRRCENILSDKSWNNEDRTTLCISFQQLLDLCYDPRKYTTDINKKRNEIIRVLNNINKPFTKDLKKMLGDGSYGTEVKGKTIFNIIFEKFRKFKSIQILEPYGTFDRLQGLALYSFNACDSTAFHIAKYFYQKGGFMTGTFNKNKSLSEKLCSLIKRKPMPSNGEMREGDIVVYRKNLNSIIEKMRIFLDDNHIIRARVLSGKAVGGDTPKPSPSCIQEEHTILIIGYDANKFVFWDPDSGVSHDYSDSFGRGFGYLYYDGQRLTTARNSNDLVVDKKGFHSLGENHSRIQKRYQVLKVNAISK
jgi:hypothetical protein